MKNLNFTKSAIFMVLLFLAGTGPGRAQGSASSKSDEVYVDFKSDEGIRRFASSKYKKAFFRLANNFEPQEITQFGGPATAAVVMNTLRGPSSKKEKPTDESRLTAEQMAVVEKGYHPFFQKFTQRNVFIEGTKSLLEVLGKPTADGHKDVGFQLRQLHALFIAQHFKSKIQIADDKLTLVQLRNEFKKCLNDASQVVVANYRRAEMGQGKPNGHVSPVAAYVEKSDSFLIMDVNPTISHWGWVKSSALLKAMQTFDTQENRGYLIVSDPEGNLRDFAAPLPQASWNEE